MKSPSILAMNGCMLPLQTYPCKITTKAPALQIAPQLKLISVTRCKMLPIQIQLLNTKGQHCNKSTLTPQENKTSDAKQLPCLIKDSKVIISPAEINYHRKVTLKDVDIDEDMKKKLETLCNDYTDIFCKHAIDVRKSDLVQMILQPKDNI